MLVNYDFQGERELLLCTSQQAATDTFSTRVWLRVEISAEINKEYGMGNFLSIIILMLS